jgi:predicted nuclease of predicted toxin-antitoxin system
MKLLFDQNLSFKLCRQLEDLFPGSSQVNLLGLGTADDRAIWRHAGVNGADLLRNHAEAIASLKRDVIACLEIH